MKKTNVMLFGLVLLVIAVSACQAQTSFESDVPTQTSTSTSGNGRVVFAVTDAAADMGIVSSVKVTVDNVQVHSATKGWTTVSSTQKTYDLLQLKAEGKQELLADAELEEGTYDQIRLDISNVIVTDAQGQHEAKLPSNQLQIKGDIIVEANATATATFDFIADESLHVTGNGKYIMAPVVQVETRQDADVDVSSDNKVEIEGGRVKTRALVGMDAEGNVGVGLRIPKDVNVTIDASGLVKIGTKASGKLLVGVGA